MSPQKEQRPMTETTHRTIAAQGDILLTALDALPEGLTRRTGPEAAIVAHSETGHHHVARALGLEVWDDPADPLTCYLRSSEPIDIVHLRDHDTHAPITMRAGVVRVRRQREWTPEGWRRVED